MPTEDRRTHVAAEEIRDLLLIPSEVDKVSPSELTAEPIATVCVCVCVCSEWREQHHGHRMSANSAMRQ